MDQQQRPDPVIDLFAKARPGFSVPPFSDAMSSPAYKGNSQQWGLWMLFSFGTIVAFLAVVMLSIHWRIEDVAGAWTFAPAAATLIGGIALGWMVTARRNRERIQRVA